nr:IgGFc-binding protein [Nannocystis sp.]
MNTTPSPRPSPTTPRCSSPSTRGARRSSSPPRPRPSTTRAFTPSSPPTTSPPSPSPRRPPARPCSPAAASWPTAAASSCSTAATSCRCSPTAGDLTGTVVDADKPVQVIGGSKCLFAPINVFACDHGEESIFPVDTLAKTYVIVPPAQYPNGVQENPQIVRVIASEANTALTFTPDQPVGKLLAAVGDFVELPAGTAKFVVSADKRVLVSQFMASSGSHPAMILAVTPAQWRDDYLVHAPPSWEVNFVDIVAKAGTAVMVDGAAIPPLTAIPGTTYAYTHVKLSNLGDGNHRITGSDKLGISIYGLQTAGSYWYPGGLDLALIPPG